MNVASTSPAIKSGVTSVTIVRHQPWSVDHRTIGADQGPGNVKINQKLDVGSVLGSEAGELEILGAERETR